MTIIVEIPQKRRQSFILAQKAIEAIDEGLQREMNTASDKVQVTLKGNDSFVEEMQHNHSGSTALTRAATMGCLSVAVSSLSLGISLYVIFENHPWAMAVLILGSMLSLGFFVAAGILLHRAAAARKQEALFNFLLEIGIPGAIGNTIWCRSTWTGTGYDIKTVRLDEMVRVYGINVAGRYNILYETAAGDIEPWLDAVSSVDFNKGKELLTQLGLKVVSTTAPPDRSLPVSIERGS